MAEQMTDREIRRRRREILQEQLRLEEENRIRRENTERERQRLVADTNLLQRQREMLLSQRRNQQRNMGVIHSYNEKDENRATPSQDKQYHTYHSDFITTRDTNTQCSPRHIADEHAHTTGEGVDQGSYIGYLHSHDRYRSQPERENPNIRYDTQGNRSAVLDKREDNKDSLDISIEITALEEKLRHLREESEIRNQNPRYRNESQTQQRYPATYSGRYEAERDTGRRIPEFSSGYRPEEMANNIHQTNTKIPDEIHRVTTYGKQQDIDQLEYLDRKLDEIEIVPREEKVRGELGSGLTDENVTHAYKEENAASSYSMKQKPTEIERRKAELVELIDMEDYKRNQILQEEKKRILDLERQRMMLDEMERRENEMKERESKLQDLERELDLRYERLRIAEAHKEREDERNKERNRVEAEFKRRNEELTRRETLLRQKEELVKQYETNISQQIHEKKSEDKTVMKPNADIIQNETKHSDDKRDDKCNQDIKRETIVQMKPEISNFSGLDPKPKNEVSLEEWKTEIKCLCVTKLYPENLIAQAVRQSLKGQARKILLNISPTATPDEIVNKVEDIFGDMSSKQTVFTQFYTAEQQPSETIVEWGLRLEEMLLLIETKRPMTLEEKNEMLRDKFWRSLYSKELKNAIRNAFESGDKFEILRRKARAEEYEMKLDKTNAIRKDIQKEGNGTEEDKHTQLLQSMMKKMEELDTKIEEYRKETHKRETQNEQRYDRPKRRDYQQRDYDRYDNREFRYNRGRYYDPRSHKHTGYKEDTYKKKEDRADTKDKQENKQDTSKDKEKLN